MIKMLDFQGKKWQVIAKVQGHRVDDPNTLKKSYGCDLVIRDSRNLFYMLNEIIDVEFEEV
tara:strand:- start:1522 stop:1704 length:183 start_codon:yes stop_codon:yes gene_type:complete